MNLDDVQKIMQILQSMKALLGQQNPWIPVYAAIGGALAGAIAAIIPNMIIERLKERRAVNALSDSIVCEVSAILTIIKHRRYLETTEQIVANLFSTPGSTRQLQVVVPDNYFKIYHANLDRVDLIHRSIRVKVVTFYQLLEAIIQDVKPGGLLSVAAQRAEPFAEALSILKQAIELGHEIEHIWGDRTRHNHGVHPIAEKASSG
ncbi:MAG: hypothetical protein NTX75_12530 [Proteobacteria bacterium]|nr:hypothetical protein [Pseudomonadota bacterium]